MIIGKGENMNITGKIFNNKINNFVIYSIFLFMLIIWLIFQFSIKLNINREKSGQYSSEYMRLCHCYNSCQYLYSHGIIYSSMDEYMKSYYYPFLESYSKGWVGNSIGFSINENGKHETKAFVTRKDNTKSPYLFSNFRKGNKLTNKELTLKEMELIIAGCNYNLIIAQNVREYFLFNHILAVEVYQKYNTDQSQNKIAFTKKSIPICDIKGDLPETNDELNIYLQWLYTIIGRNELKDYWNNRLIIKIIDKKLICISLGEDGKFNTNDDITVCTIVNISKPKINPF